MHDAKKGEVFSTLSLLLVGKRFWQFELGAQCTSWMFPVEDEDLGVGLLPERQLDLYEHQTNPALSKLGEETSSCFGVEVQLEDDILSFSCYLEFQTTSFLWLFQMDDSESLHKKNECLGFQVDNIVFFSVV